MPLTDVAVRTAKPGPKSYKLTDERGLYVEVTPRGGKWWRLRYRFDGREKLLSLGVYPDVSLATARSRRDDARRLLASGVDPGAARKAEKASRAAAGANSFEAIAREWYEVKRGDWADSYGSKIIRRLEADVFPYLGRAPIASIKPPELLEVLRRIERRGVIETAHRALENCSQVFRYAVQSGRAESDPGRDLKDALKRPQTTHFPAITQPERLAELLRAMDGYAGTPVVRAALQLAPMLLVRPGELRFAAWEEFDLAGALWTVPAARMKRRKHDKLHGDPHLVPLPRQAVAVLADLHPLTGPDGYVFRGERAKSVRPMSENTVNAALRAMGFAAAEVVGHGFRATARTMLQERLGFDRDVIEAQLAHAVPDTLGRAYNRTQFIEQRRVMMQAWADYLERLRNGGSVLPFPGANAAA